MKQGILGGLQNKIGSVVGSSWKGIPVLKSKPLSVSNPRTAGQIAQRTKMTNVVVVAKAILASIIKPLWDRFASKMSGYNAFVTENIALFALAHPSVYASFVISKGKMVSTPINTALTDISTNTTVLTWLDDSGEGLKINTDIAYGVLYNANKNTWSSKGLADERSETNLALPNPTGTLLGDVVHAWIAFRRADGTVVSNTSYKQCTVQA
jgi:hypothetical protein